MSTPRITSSSGPYTSLTPARILDTRSGTGAPVGAVSPGGTVSLTVDGVGGVPASGVGAVVLNVTVSQPSAAGYVTVYPDGSTRPLASNLNFSPGETVPNLVVAPVGSDGKVDLYNGSGGTVHLIADVSGYFTNGGSSSNGSFTPLTPARLLDTRNGTGAPKAPVSSGGTISLAVEGQSGVPSTGVSAVVLNVTVTQPSAAGYVTVYPDGSTRPLASNVNFSPGETVPNLVIAPVGSDGKVDLYNGSGGSTQLVADVSGYFTGLSSPSVGAFNSLTPARVLDTRNGTGSIQAAVPSNGTVSLVVTGRGGLPAIGVAAVVLNVTATQPGSPGYITAYGDGTSRPVASNLNFVAGETVPNLVIAPVGTDGKIDLYNGSSGTVQLVADVSGYFGVGGAYLGGVSTIISNGSTDCALLFSGGVDCWGNNSDGELGNGSGGTTDQSASPVEVSGVGGSGTLSGVTNLAVGYDSFCAALTSGEVVCWGENGYGELGNGTDTAPDTCEVEIQCADVPEVVVGVGDTGTLGGVAQVDGFNTLAGHGYCAVLTSGGVDCWGYIAGSDSLSPVSVPGVGGTGSLGGVSTLVGDDEESTCALLTSGGVDCWGPGGNGRLGDGSLGGSPNPVKVLAPGGGGALSGVSQLLNVYGGTYCAVISSGGVDCWGADDQGQAGDGTTNSTGLAVPVQVVGESGAGTLSGVTEIASGGGNDSDVCALLSSGGVDCWGESYGYLGDGKTTGSTIPVAVVGVGGVGFLTGSLTVISSNGGFCVVLTAGGLDCWGDDGYLGNGQSASTTPVEVSGIGGTGTLSGVAAAISPSGGTKTCAILSSGGVDCWGSGDLGIGDDSLPVDYPTPVVAVNS